MTFTHEQAVAVDTELAALFEEQHDIRAKLAQLRATVRRAAGQREVTERGRRTNWTGTWDEAVAAAVPVWHEELRRQSLAEIEGRLIRLDCVEDEQAALEAVWDEHQWSRFFLVDNHDGHIHKTMQCSTCFPTTRFRWLPALSGLTEAEAVTAHGSILCTICFPSAPVEWTNGISHEAQAAKDAKAAEKAAKLAKKGEKALFTDDPKRCVRVISSGGFRQDISTVFAAKEWLVSSIEYPTLYTAADRHAVAQALGTKLGQTEAEVLYEASQALKRRRQRERAS